MKTLYLLTLTLVAIIVASCGDVNAPIIADDFFPLRVGDKFLYRLSPESDNYENTTLRKEIEVKVTRKVDSLGKTYYVIENYFLFSEKIVYARKENSNVYFFCEGEEVLYYRFDLPLDSMYRVPLNMSDTFDFMKVVERDKNFVLFFWGVYITDIEIYTRFEKDKGRTKIINYSYGPGISIYNLVKVYR
jgi:hypothetical protein